MTEPAKSPPRILCAGGAVQDIVMRVDKFPDAGTKVQASEFLITIGGQAGNAAVAAARLGAKVSYAGPFGDRDDDIANGVVGSLEREGVDCRHAVRVPGAISSVSTIMLDSVGEKMIATRRGRGLNDAVPHDAAAAVASVDAVLLDNRYATFSMSIGAAARARGIPRVLDFDKPTPPDDPLLQACTHVICSADALRESTGLDDLAQGLLQLGASYRGFLAVTDGPDGVYWVEDGMVRHMDAFKVQAIDTLGAGDTFHGAFAVRLVEGGNVVEAMRFAAAAAAIKCTRFGGLIGAPTRAEVEEFLEMPRNISASAPNPKPDDGASVTAKISELRQRTSQAGSPRLELANRIHEIAASISELRINSLGKYIQQLYEISDDLKQPIQPASTSIKTSAAGALSILQKIYEELGSRTGARIIIAGAVAGIVAIGGWPMITAFALTLSAWHGQKAFTEAIKKFRIED